MLRVGWWYLLVVLLVGLSIGPLSANEVLSNATFETGSLAPWVIGPGFGLITQDWTVTSTYAHSGTYSATVLGDQELKQTFAGVSVDSISEVSFWVMHPFTTVPVEYDFLYSDSTDSIGFTSVTTPGWNFFDVTSELTPGKTLTGFAIWGYSAGYGRTVFDDLKIITVPFPGGGGGGLDPTGVPEPGTFVLAGVALASLIGFRRRLFGG